MRSFCVSGETGVCSICEVMLKGKKNENTFFTVMDYVPQALWTYLEVELRNNGLNRKQMILYGRGMTEFLIIITE